MFLASWANSNSSLGLIFAFQVLPTIIFIASFFALLYYLGVMQVIIRGAAWVMQRVMGASGAESLNVAASIFMGQTEAPLTIRPFLPDLTQSELMTVMTSGMAHVSGGIMAAYIAFGVDAKHLITAVIMTAPGTLLMAKMFVPRRKCRSPPARYTMEQGERDQNFLAAIARGTSDGLNLAINVAAMLIAFLALIYLCNGILGGIHNRAGRAWICGVSFELAADLWLGFRAHRLGHRRALARLHHDRQPAGHPHGAERTGGVFFSRTDARVARPALIYHRHICVVRLRQLQLHRNADCRHRGARTQQEKRSRASGHSRHARGHHGELDVRFDCGHVPAMNSVSGH